MLMVCSEVLSQHSLSENKLTVFLIYLMTLSHLRKLLSSNGEKDCKRCIEMGVKARGCSILSYQSQHLPDGLEENNVKPLSKPVARTKAETEIFGYKAALNTQWRLWIIAETLLRTDG
jgi:hypothetical protein